MLTAEQWLLSSSKVLSKIKLYSITMYTGIKKFPLHHISANKKPRKVVSFHHSRHSGGTLVLGAFSLHFIPDFHSTTTTMHPLHNIFAAVAVFTAALAATLVTKKVIQKHCRKYRSHRPQIQPATQIQTPQTLATIPDRKGTLDTVRCNFGLRRRR